MHAQKMSAVWSIVLLDCAFNPVQSPLHQRHVRNIVYQSCFVFLHFLLSFSWADSLRARWDLKKIAGYFVCIFVFSFKSWLSSLFFFLHLGASAFQYSHFKAPMKTTYNFVLFKRFGLIVLPALVQQRTMLYSLRNLTTKARNFNVGNDLLEGGKKQRVDMLTSCSI